LLSGSESGDVAGRMEFAAQQGFENRVHDHGARLPGDTLAGDALADDALGAFVSGKMNHEDGTRIKSSAGDARLFRSPVREFVPDVDTPRVIGGDDDRGLRC